MQKEELFCFRHSDFLDRFQHKKVELSEIKHIFKHIKVIKKSDEDEINSSMKKVDMHQNYRQVAPDSFHQMIHLKPNDDTILKIKE